MADQLPSWLSIDGAIGDLTLILPNLQTYADLFEHWRDVAAKIYKVGADAPIDNPVKLVTYLAGKLDDPAIMESFSKLGLDDLRAKLFALGQELTDTSAPWAKLLMPCDSFVENYGPTPGPVGELEDGDNPGLVALKIPSLSEGTTVAAGPSSLKFDVSAAAGLECEAGSVWPFRGDAVPTGLLRIGADGKLGADMGLSLPFGEVGTGRASVSASAEARLDLFFRPRIPSQSFAEVLVAVVTSVPNPLDLSAINHAVALAGMEGIVLSCNGTATAGLGATLGASYDIANIGSITAGLVADLTFKRGARWILSLRATTDGLHFVLSRNLSRDRDWSVGLDLDLDYSALARKVHDALVKTDELATPLLARIKPFLSPGTYLAEHAGTLVDTAVSAITSDPGLRAALEKDVGLILGSSQGDDLETSAYLKGRLVDLAADQAGGILADTDAWTRRIAAGLTGNLPLLACADLSAKLTDGIRPMLIQLRSDFDTTVQSLLATQGFAAELKSVGVSVASTETDANALLAGVRSLVDRFDSFSRQLIATTGDGIKQKLEARFAWSGGSSSGTQYELIGTFRDTSDAMAPLWRTLVTGHLEPFQRFLAEPANVPPGLVLDAASSLSRFAGDHRGFALEISILGISASIKTIVEGKAQINVSAGGDVAVNAQGAASVAVDGFDEGRAASFVNAWDLALHKADGGGERRMSVAIAFDHSDKTLDPGEVSGFLGGLATQGLVEPARVQRATEVYQAWRNATPPGKHVQGRIDVRMALTGVAVTRMLELGRGGGIKGSPRQLALFSYAGHALLEAQVTDQKHIDRDGRQARSEFDQLAHVDDPWRIMYALQDVDLTPPDAGGQQGYVYSAFEQIIPRAISFPRLLVDMAQIYDAIPVGALLPGVQWSASDFARVEIDLATQARVWLRLNQKFVFWFKAGLHPVMLAFLRMLSDTNRQLLVGEDPFESLGQRVDTLTSSPLFAITMTQANGTPVSV